MKWDCPFCDYQLKTDHLDSSIDIIEIINHLCKHIGNLATFGKLDLPSISFTKKERG